MSIKGKKLITKGFGSNNKIIKMGMAKPLLAKIFKFIVNIYKKVIFK